MAPGLDKWSGLLLSSLFLVAFICGCGSAPGGSASGTTRVEIVLGAHPSSSYPAALRSVLPRAIPSNVERVRVTVSAPDMTTMVQDAYVVPGDNSVSVSVDVPNGTNRLFVVEVFNAIGTLLYRGESYADLTGNPADGSAVPVTVLLTAMDTTVPTVSSVSPLADATGVALTTAVEVVFSEPINCSTVSSSSFNVRNSSGFIAGNLGCVSPGSANVSFTPLANLDPDTTYTVTLVGGAGGLKDVYDIPMAADNAWSFTTGALPGAVGNLIALDAGGYHSLALTGDRYAWGWGFNGNGELGDGTSSDMSVPVQVAGIGGESTLGNVGSVSGGASHSLARLSDGTVVAWGFNGNGQLGDGTAGNSSVPVQVVGAGGSGILDNVIAVSAGGYHSLALLSGGTVRAWGFNGSGQLGDGTAGNSSVPVQVVGAGGAGVLDNVVAVSAGANHSLALLSDGTVRAWGSNAFGQLGDNTTIDTSMPVRVAGPGGAGILGNVVAVSAGAYHSLALRSDGTVWAWGDNGGGQLGDGMTVSRSSPVQVNGTGGPGIHDKVVAVSAGDYHSLALMIDGTVRAWGYGTFGQLGNGTTANSSSPVQVAGSGGAGYLDNVISVSAGVNHSLALRSDGTALAWGANGSGQLGDGTFTATRAFPEAVSFP